MTQQLALSKHLPKKLAPCSPALDDAELQVKLEKSARLKQVLFWSFAALAVALFISVQPVFAADTIWTKFSDVMKDIYGKLLGISTIIAVTAATIALLVRMISRNQRAVDEATTWLKRIVITWIILNTLGFIIAYLQPWFAGGQYTP